MWVRSCSAMRGVNRQGKPREVAPTAPVGPARVCRCEFRGQHLRCRHPHHLTDDEDGNHERDDGDCVQAMRIRNGRPMHRSAGDIRPAGGTRDTARVSRIWPKTMSRGPIASSRPQVEAGSPYEDTAMTGSTVSKPQ